MNRKDVIQTGKSVLEIEAKAVESMAARLDDSFAEAVALLSKCPSRVIVIGMGKSGIVGRKIAATLASCGTPAIFINAAEAGHGDLGMIIPKDIVVAISYSGRTKELVDVLDFVKRTGIKLISITGDVHSTLAEYSDIVLNASVEKEAEPSGLVPTASSTCALALGDALAIALMEKKGFGKEEFALYHPKGSLGKKLRTVGSMMHKGTQVPKVTERTVLKDILQEMSNKKMGMTCVLDDGGKLSGIITDGDIRRILQKYGETAVKKTAKECMTADPLTIKKDDLAAEALNIMEEHKITSLIIKDEKGCIEGIIHLHDLWRTEMV